MQISSKIVFRVTNPLIDKGYNGNNKQYGSRIRKDELILQLMEVVKLNPNQKDKN